MIQPKPFGTISGLASRSATEHQQEDEQVHEVRDVGQRTVTLESTHVRPASHITSGTTTTEERDMPGERSVAGDEQEHEPDTHKLARHADDDAADWNQLIASIQRSSRGGCSA